MKKYSPTKFSIAILIVCFLLIIADIVSLVFIKDNGAQSRIAFQMFEIVVMMAVIAVPLVMDKTIHFKMPATMEIVFVTFCFSSLILGDVADFYARFTWWDNLLHGISGFLLGILAYAIINTFNSIHGNKLRFPPFFVAIWVVSFAMACGAIWEIMEYTLDGVFGLNSQQFLTTSGTFDGSAPLMGREALKDTMEDLMLDLLGSSVTAIIGYFDLKRQRRSIADIAFTQSGE